MILQPCMKNRKEYKVVVLNEIPVYVSFNPRNLGPSKKSFSKAPHENLLAFASDAVEKLKTNCKESITDGLIRVDVFQNQQGNFVVNEFESLDANFSSNEMNMVKDSHTSEFLVFYWIEKLATYFSLFEKN